MKLKIVQVYLILITTIILFITIFFNINIIHKFNTQPKLENTYYSLDVTTLDLNEENLMFLLNYYKVEHPQIVYTQAILETGYFKSVICNKYNNIFGLYNSSIKDFYHFNHWSESILAYKKYIQYKYIPNDCYYTFLKELPYAEDSLYINKLKYLQNGI